MKKAVVKKIVIGILISLILIIVGYIMYNRLGLIEKYDFGAGAYYYTDIPNYDEIMNNNQYKSGVPLWILWGIFILWGVVMYILWRWLDKKLCDNN